MDFAGRKIFTQDVTVSGNGNVVINGNRVTVNGKLVKDFNDVNEKTIYVIVNGDVGIATEVDKSIQRQSKIFKTNSYKYIVV
jgi:hypothetical protein